LTWEISVVGGDVSARARPILDDKLLTEALGQELADQARYGVLGRYGRSNGAAACWASRSASNLPSGPKCHDFHRPAQNKNLPSG
jgi:hypothetical protein